MTVKRNLFTPLVPCWACLQSLNLTEKKNWRNVNRVFVHVNSSSILHFQCWMYECQNLRLSVHHCWNALAIIVWATNEQIKIETRMSHRKITCVCVIFVNNFTKIFNQISNMHCDNFGHFIWIHEMVLICIFEMLKRMNESCKAMCTVNCCNSCDWWMMKKKTHTHQPSTGWNIDLGVGITVLVWYFRKIRIEVLKCKFNARCPNIIFNCRKMIWQIYVQCT